MNLSATIITLNEEKNIARTIRSLDFVEEVIVVDSGSIDQTCNIAMELGAKVFNNKFLGYGQQKNFAAGKCQNDWILSIDADEEVTEELKQSIKSIDFNDLDPVNSFYLSRRTMYCNKWIYHGGWYPDNLIRLYNRNEAAWTTPFVHEIVVPLRDGNLKTSHLEGHLNHYSFPTVKSQVLTNIKYASLGARDLLAKKGRRPRLFEVLGRPVGKFIECYFIKRGFLDGLAGLIIAINASYSMFMKYSFAYFDSD